MSNTAFIAYTRSTGAACAARLQKLLTERGIGVWQDRAQMIAGVDFWRQIEEAIERCSHLVMVVTPDALEGDRAILRRECYTARKSGKCVVPVMGQPGMRPDDDRLPRWLPSRHIYDLDFEVEKFVAHAASPCTLERIPFMVGDLPDNYVPRPRELDALIDKLLDERHEAPVAIATALRGAGGFGKTTLAQAICHDDRIITAFKDGILWATLGEEAQSQGNVEKKLAGLYAALTNQRPNFVDRDDAANELAGKLQFKSCLIVVDDVWTMSELKPFLRGAGSSARLITTRLAGIAAQSNAATVMVDEMRPEEADALLAAGLLSLQLDAATLRRVTRQLGEWPLLINLFAGHVRQLVLEGMQTEAAVSHLTRVLDEVGVTALDRDNEADRSLAVKTTLGVSLARIPAAELAALLDLAVFPEDLNILVAVIGELWSLGSTATLERLRRFGDLGLIKLALGTASIRIHDVIRRYLGERHERLAEAHRRMADAWPDRRKLPHDYAWRWLPYHLAKSGRTAELRTLLLDFAWLRAKLEATDLGSLMADFDLLPADDAARLVHGALRIAAYCLAADKSQLAGQLAGRLRMGVDPDLDVLIRSLPGWRGEAWLRPLRPTLHAPGGALARVMRGYAGGHRGTIRSIRSTVSAGGRFPPGTPVPMDA